MVQVIAIKRTATPNNPPTLIEGELGVEMATRPKLWIGVPTTVDAAGRVLVNPPGGVFIGDAPPAAPVAGQLWWKSDIGRTFVWYTDVDSSQWVEI